jgi:hypothetical protein
MAPMTRIIELHKTKPEVADILRQHIQDYEESYSLWPEQKKIVTNLTHCRTSHLGGHIERCDHCEAERLSYHSCRNRHCPKCQQIPREKWLKARESELLPVSYFHVIFTLPHELNHIVLSNKRVMFNILFKAVSKTLLKFGEDQLGGRLGFIATLHTWDQKLKSHFHLHCLVAGGVLSPDRRQWIPCKNDYLFNAQALSLVFRGKFVDLMNRARKDDKLCIADDKYSQLKDKLYSKKWVVNVRDPFDRAQPVLEYIARYTHRVAIANSRIQELKGGMVTFGYKDRKNNTTATETLSAVKFIHRFFLHILPLRFVRIRQYGFLANRNRKANLSHIRLLLKSPPQPDHANTSTEQMMIELTGVDITRCPYCQEGQMLVVAEIPRGSGKHPNHFIRPPNRKLRATG